MPNTCGNQIRRIGSHHTDAEQAANPVAGAEAVHRLPARLAERSGEMGGEGRCTDKPDPLPTYLSESVLLQFAFPIAMLLP